MRRTLSILVLFAGVTFVAAQNTTTQTQVIKTTTIMGANVALQQETLGKVVDIVISDGGCIEYLVVGYENKFIPIPYSAVRVQNNSLVITSQNVTRQQLVGLAFTGANYPSYSNQAFVRSFQQVFGQGAIRTGSGGTSIGGDRNDVNPSGKVNDPTPPKLNPNKTPGNTPGTKDSKDNKDNKDVTPPKLRPNEKKGDDSSSTTPNTDRPRLNPQTDTPANPKRTDDPKRPKD